MLLQVDGVSVLDGTGEAEGELVLDVEEGKAQHHTISFGASELAAAQEL